MRNPLKTYEGKVIALVVLLFAVRLFHITDPPIEVSHNWRQTTSLMVARNFYQLDNNILYPTLDETGDQRGVVGMEFPILSYTIYLTSEVFGYEHWYGRMIALIVVSIGLWFFYRLLCLYFEKKHAWYATVAFAFSALFHLARKVLPDPVSLSLVIIGLYYGTQFLRIGKWKYLLPYLLFATLGALVKIPFGLYLVILAFPFFGKGISRQTRIVFVFASILCLTIVFWWYFVWNVHLSETFGLWYNSGRSLRDGFRELGENLGDVLYKFYFSAFHGYLFFVLTLAGLFYVIQQREKKILWLLLITSPMFFIYMSKSGFLFAHHGYYALVIVPVMCVLVGYFAIKIPAKWASIALLVCIVESVANQYHDFFIRKSEYFKIHLEEISAQVTQPNDLVALATNLNPNEFYFLNRKGWMVNANDVNDEFISELAKKGCKYLFLRRDSYNEALKFPRIFEDEEYIVFGLQLVE